ncbi:tRNA nucleotidyltransferase (CCA-adding enzyme) [Halalkaliarchaeum sp. AArc-CO]|uniref:CCA tRNA nucleotidyltransferase n=1 Tax=Halalkaliarchaeum sp. AArc-CO TaxID=2866381 RepID=UPI00217CF73E|nr:CCA tRNA nucleotidyltransferase [Halalkaliarchaeum sp. AArc-CO]UWG52187.1 tRNA nucleotidyltransferase (CCA-adding enzyme) [Halalkaliarchaeum sp. AArc-CO]
MSLEAVLSAVEARVTPDEAERARFEEVAGELRERTLSALSDLDVEGDVVLVGSTARGTWLSGDRDIDMFVRLPPEIDRSELVQYGLTIGHEVLPDGREEYAEHPYVKGIYEGFDVDLVPCYDVEDAEHIQSAVDRTPFHSTYLEENLDDELARDVRLAKRFLKGIGAYGSDLRTRGFSGYLTELLVCEYDGFVPLVEAAAEWHPPVELDPEEHGRETFTDPLIVIDPTDPERNVAAVLSAENLARFQHYSRALLEDPREELFFPPEREPLSAAELRAHVRDRRTTPVAVVFEAPDVVDDQLWPQLRRTLGGVIDGLDDHGFDVFRADTFVEDTGGPADEQGQAVLFLELASPTVPAVSRHVGPPVSVRSHAEGFYEKYAGRSGRDDGTDDRLYGPFLVEDRYIVERPREFTDASEYLRSEVLLEVRTGAQIEDALEDRTVLVGDEVDTLVESFGRDLAAYFDPRP